VLLTSTGSASCPREQCGIAVVTRPVQTLPQQADALGKEVHSLVQASLQLAHSPQDLAIQVQLLRKVKASMQHVVRTAKAEATTVLATVPTPIYATRHNVLFDNLSCHMLQHRDVPPMETRCTDAFQNREMNARDPLQANTTHLIIHFEGGLTFKSVYKLQATCQGHTTRTSR
jgi:hypothetical protein